MKFIILRECKGFYHFPFLISHVFFTFWLFGFIRNLYKSKSRPSPFLVQVPWMLDSVFLDWKKKGKKIVPFSLRSFLFLTFCYLDFPPFNAGYFVSSSAVMQAMLFLGVTTLTLDFGRPKHQSNWEL